MGRFDQPYIAVRLVCALLTVSTSSFIQISTMKLPNH